jgi:UDP-N-acetylmuramoyl-L-alanyl-D-glutamate--2,6-diaminopimelate ligase
MLNSILDLIRPLIPKKIFKSLQPIYHYKLALLSAIFYRFPSRQIHVVGITGTKGKSSTAEFVNAILEANGYKTALLSTIRFKVGSESKPNLYKMSVPGRFFVQRFIRRAVNAKCDWVVLELTSESVKQFRHKFINLDALIFTNISPEHIESHGSFENYLNAKLKLAKLLEKSSKPRTVMVANADDPNGYKFLEINVDETVSFRMNDGKPWAANEGGVSFSFDGVRINSPLRGEFMIANALASAQFAKSQGIATNIIKQGIEKVTEISGRVQFVRLDNKNPKANKQNFDVVVDYAHTIDSLTKLYETFPKKKICVLGNTGGGRDKWKRKGMAEVADKYCDEIILTNEDPYDENPKEIVEQMKEGVKNKPCNIIMDRREAIKTALGKARAGDTVLISGKGTDPYIMEAKGKKTPWSDYKVAQEELEKVLK